MEIDFNSQREEVRSRKRKQKTGGEEEIGQWKHRSGTGEEEIGHHSPPIKCLEMEKMTADEREVFTKLIYDLSQDNLYIGKAYYDPSFWVKLVNLYNERLQGLNGEYTKRTWVDMISMGQDLECRYNKLRAARQHIDRELEAIFGLCPCCKRRIPIIPTTLQDKHLGNSGGVMRNVCGNSGKSGGQKSRSVYSRGGHSSRSVPLEDPQIPVPLEDPQIPNDILKVMQMLLMEKCLTMKQFINMSKPINEWIAERHIILGLIRDSEIPPFEKAQVLISAAGLGHYNN